MSEQRDGFVNKSTFAKIYGCGPSYVSKLIDENKVVLSEDGKLVNVEASFALLEVTSDPSKQGVRERWKDYRAGKQVIAPPTSDQKQPGAPLKNSGADNGSGSQDGGSSEYHKARTKKEQAEARIKEIELDKQLRLIAEVAPIQKALTDTHTAARSAIQELPDRLTALVAPETDPLKVHELIREECERICEGIAHDVQQLRSNLKEEDA